MMSKGGLIIRLIDVVLILLLGFIGISDFTMKSQIKLPQGSRVSDGVFKKKVSYIRVDKNNHFEVETDQRKITGITQITDVEHELLQQRAIYRQNHTDLVVIIEPDMETIIQTTVDLLDMCEKNNISKSIHYEF